MARTSDKQRRDRLDAEVGTLRKHWHGHIHVALVFPNHYAVGMANLGFQTVYGQLNALDHVVCERAFLPDDQGEGSPPRTLESGRSLRDFDCLAFALSFENDYANVLTVLKTAQIPLQSAARGPSDPLVVAGGVACFLNPEPIAAFFDCFLLGEAEELIVPFFKRFDPATDRRHFLLQAAREVPGIYVPAFYQDHYNADGTLAGLSPLLAVPEQIRRMYSRDIAGFSTQSVIITPETSFEDAHLLEVSRGCPHGFRALPQLQQAMQRAGAHTCKIGLLGAAVSDLPDLKTLCDIGHQCDLQLSFSSLRADALDEALITALKGGRLKTATIAPETGSERMRRVINKGLDETAILHAAELLVTHGIPNLKLYFMVGLPTETNADVDEIVGLVKRIKHCFLRSSQARGHMGEITVGLHAFVPKPFTPFQWAAMDDLAQLKQKIKRVKEGLRKVANVRVHADVPRWALIQALLARGDRRVSQMLLMADANGGNWPQTFKAAPLNPAFYIHRPRTREEILPWDIIDHGLDKTFLWNEYQRALQAKATLPCPADPENCSICGVCKNR